MLKRVIATQREAFPDFRLRSRSCLNTEDKVVARWQASGTHRGEFLGLAPTERRATVEGLSIDRWAGDRIVESWIAYDVLSILQQLGAAPAPGSTTERIGKLIQRLAVRSGRWMRKRRSRVRAPD